MNRLLRLCAASLLLGPLAARAQQAEPAPTRPTIGRPVLQPYAAPAAADTGKARTLAEAFGRGQWRGRNYFIMSQNRGSLPSYYANGLGAGARFETAPLHGVSVGAGGFFWVSLAANDLATPDAATGAVSRYGVGLFDVRSPGRRQLTGRPEELFVRYRWRQSAATFGRQLLVTPLLNPQDGRLSPNYAQGVWLEVNELAHTRFTAGGLTHLAVRSTSEWAPVASSNGLYSAGVDEASRRAAYTGQLSSRGRGVLGASQQRGPRTRVLAWNYYADNLFNSLFTELTTGRAVGAGAGQLTLGAQYHYQRTVGTGGNPDPHLAYSAPGRQAHGLSGRLGYQRGPWSLSANYTRITHTKRFLFPREWGREPFYTFLPREREEGFGGLDAAALLASYAVPAGPGLKAEVGYGPCYLPEVTDLRLNKYGMPS
ncbi:OprD family outer membrane porin [Hymenobacter sp. H14-R3]|uniref:OprD family outer membrane porin n=1 Tax=Hymenobacter sp. H14-R3 TaxID=3046308 RepID=UPI0024BBA338|nr:OprD family outer membrane porin [Hymenobacter sp. H14-R3]MDJ0367596.1 OprD family outer membrane porin [Hymenobacter sp. H14-R3]